MREGTKIAQELRVFLGRVKKCCFARGGDNKTTGKYAQNSSLRFRQNTLFFSSLKAFFLLILSVHHKTKERERNGEKERMKESENSLKECQSLRKEISLRGEWREQWQ